MPELPATRGGSRRQPPTVLLVHGAFVGSWTWTGVVEQAAARGWPALAVANPLRSLDHDAAYVAAVSDTVAGPVLMVGHGYGGAVITVAATVAREAVGLVYVAGFAVAEPERSIDLLLANPDQRFVRSLRPRLLRPTSAARVELVVDPDEFHATLAADLDPRRASSAAAIQRPVAASALEERPTACAWRSLPCWSLVPVDDRVLDLETHHRLAERAGAPVIQVAASHLVPITQPAAVVSLLDGALAELT